jgi:site-specific DNA-cytosine methylase
MKGTGSVLLYSTQKHEKEAEEKHDELLELSLEPLPKDFYDVSTRNYQENWWPQLKEYYLKLYPEREVHIRYFTPRELLNLFGFPQDYRFPPQITKKKQYELIGNSINVTVVSYLLREMFEVL